MHLRSVAEGTLFVLGVLVIGLDDTIAEPGADVAGRGEVVLHCVGKFLKLGREFELCNRGGPLATSLSCAALVRRTPLLRGNRLLRKRVQSL